MDFSGAAAHSILAHISGELAGTAPHVQSILTTLTRSLSRIRSGTWFAVLLDLDPSTSHVVVAGDSDGSMSAYVDAFVEYAWSSDGIESPEPKIVEDLAALTTSRRTGDQIDGEQMRAVSRAR